MDPAASRGATPSHGEANCQCACFSAARYLSRLAGWLGRETRLAPFAHPMMWRSVRGFAQTLGSHILEKKGAGIQGARRYVIARDP